MIKKIQFGLMAVCIASMVGMIFTPQGKLGSAMAYVALASLTGFYGLLLVPQRDESDVGVTDRFVSRLSVKKNYGKGNDKD